MGGYYNGKDSVDISELAALDADISDDMIEKLQQQLIDKMEQGNAKKSSEPNKIQQSSNENDDSTLFEEVNQNSSDAQPTVPNEAKQEPLQNNEANSTSDNQTKPSDDTDSQQKEKLEVNQNFDDNFIKKYKAKLQKMTMTKNETEAEADQAAVGDNKQTNAPDDGKEPIEKVSKGKISEKNLTKELKEYNASLDFLDGNIKYSKYVIYIDPENINFIESLTVKERKNLINRILRQQDDILIAKKNFRVLQNLFINVLIAVLIFLAAVPIVYYAINASLEATINNHRNAQMNWQVLYKEHGKISKYN